MVQGIFNAIAAGINAQKATLESARKSGDLNDPKQLSALDKLETLSDAFTSTADLNATETFDDNGTRTLTYTDPTTNMPVRSTSYAPSGGKIADAHYENGVLVDSGTYDPATNRKLTASHYDNGALTQTDTLDEQGNVSRVDKFDPATGKPISSRKLDSDGNLMESTSFYPGTDQPQRVDKFTPPNADGMPELASEKMYYPDGTLAGERDNQTGIAKKYDESGNLTEEIDYKGDGSSNSRYVRKEFDPTTHNVIFQQKDTGSTDGLVDLTSEVTIYDSTGNLTSRTVDYQGFPVSKLTVDPETGAVSISKYGSDGNVTGTQNFKSMEDYQAFQYEQQQIEKIIDKNNEKAFQAFQ